MSPVLVLLQRLSPWQSASLSPPALLSSLLTQPGRSRCLRFFSLPPAPRNPRGASRMTGGRLRPWSPPGEASHRPGWGGSRRIQTLAEARADLRQLRRGPGRADAGMRSGWRSILCWASATWGSGLTSGPGNLSFSKSLLGRSDDFVVSAGHAVPRDTGQNRAALGSKRKEAQAFLEPEIPRVTVHHPCREP